MLLEALQKRACEKEFLLGLLHYHKPDAVYFQKTYVGQARQRKPKQEGFRVNMGNADGFLTTELTTVMQKKNKGRANMGLFFNKEQRANIIQEQKKHSMLSTFNDVMARKMEKEEGKDERDIEAMYTALLASAPRVL